MIFYSASLKILLQYHFIVISIRFISLQHLAVVCHHVCIPSSLVSALRNHNILAETFTLLFTSRHQDSQERSQYENADNATLYLYCNSVYGNCWGMHSLHFHNLGFFYKKKYIYFTAFLNDFQAFSSVLCMIFSNFSSCINFFISGPTKRPSLYLHSINT